MSSSLHGTYNLEGETVHQRDASLLQTVMCDGNGEGAVMQIAVTGLL